MRILFHSIIVSSYTPIKPTNRLILSAIISGRNVTSNGAIGKVGIKDVISSLASFVALGSKIIFLEDA